MTVRRIKGATGNLYDKHSRACHSALQQLAEFLKDIGFAVRTKSPSESTLRVYPIKLNQHPLLNPRFKENAIALNEALGQECLIFSVLSAGDPTLDRRLQSYPSTHGCRFIATGERGGKFYYHGHFVVSLPFKRAAPSNEIDFKRLRRPIRDIFHFFHDSVRNGTRPKPKDRRRRIRDTAAHTPRADRCSAPWRVSLGQREPHHRELQRLARTNETTHWTITSDARPGDPVAFYLKKPDSAVVATGTAVTFPDKVRRGQWRGHYMAKIAGIRMLPTPVPLRVLRLRFPSWRWTKSPRTHTTAPPDLISRFARLLCAKPNPVALFPNLSRREGTPVEHVVTRRGRSRLLRNQALARSKGLCTVCGEDFSRLLGGLGVRVLQVHHRKQLAATSSPSITRLSDLAVLCANCHALVHADPNHALSVQTLRRLLLKSP